MRKLLNKISSIAILLILNSSIYSQSYTISFSAIGSANTVDSVIVENLTHPNTVKWHTGDVLKLILSNGINEIGKNDQNLQVYPNPMQGKAEILFYAKQAGNSALRIYDISGKEVLQVENKLLQGIQKYQLVGLKQGVYFANIVGDGYFYTAKIISQNTTQSEVMIEYIGGDNLSTTIHKLKNTNSTVNMIYSTGDRLLFKGISGNYSNITTDIPTASKTITFNFTTCTDGDNNNYATVQIGTQTWMAENLKTTKFKDGSVIPNITDITPWNNTLTPAYCWYNNNIAYKNTYGALYNWYAVHNDSLCPAGWHSPTYSEWTILETYLGGSSIAGGKLKEVGTTHWSGQNVGANNEFGFTSLPGGSRLSTGDFQYIGTSGYWWSSSEYNAISAWNRSMFNIYIFLNFANGNHKTAGNSVRCLKN